jgi:hypothetical protein
MDFAVIPIVAGEIDAPAALDFSTHDLQVLVATIGADCYDDQGNDRHYQTPQHVGNGVGDPSAGVFPLLIVSQGGTSE